MGIGQAESIASRKCQKESVVSTFALKLIYIRNKIHPIDRLVSNTNIRSDVMRTNRTNPPRVKNIRL